ncbi:hypothetical protein IW261DRAFT_654562 [Armillaria novae-zelandiae]|uniref:Uncharacterized protein n=1 Tax=Armillaria novae-zelandiae TaxID=153914 RepID=A0AA39UQ19_9AGAR|nr:hypothetical protein IW261DRAFT_654562 [Armillaria novae-zelandiae]
MWHRNEGKKPEADGRISETWTVNSERRALIAWENRCGGMPSSCGRRKGGVGGGFGEVRYCRACAREMKIQTMETSISCHRKDRTRNSDVVATSNLDSEACEPCLNTRKVGEEMLGTTTWQQAIKLRRLIPRPVNRNAGGIPRVKMRTCTVILWETRNSEDPTCTCQTDARWRLVTRLEWYPSWIRTSPSWVIGSELVDRRAEHCGRPASLPTGDLGRCARDENPSRRGGPCGFLPRLSSSARQARAALGRISGWIGRSMVSQGGLEVSSSDESSVNASPA